MVNMHTYYRNYINSIKNIIYLFIGYKDDSK